MSLMESNKYNRQIYKVISIVDRSSLTNLTLIQKLKTKTRKEQCIPNPKVQKEWLRRSNFPASESTDRPLADPHTCLHYLII